MEMNVSLKSLFSNVTIRAHVAFVLAVAESVLPQLKSHSKGFALAQKALNDAWKWQEKSDISADELTNYMGYGYDRHKDLSLLEEYYEENEMMTFAALAVIYAFAYATYYAYILEGNEISVPDTISQVPEETIIKVVNLASKTNEFDENYTKRLVDFLFKNYRTDNPNDFGSPVSRDDLLGLKAA